ncbi:RNA methyltransferase, RsmE family [Alkalispirochaeta americana]|uniref:Ribosomal RNA small subunit methyltransferase E n=1 Tax=Alkalispirochaeta americana TaxID=159291 RepID=A0A1N6UZR9_9SPIO|nr:RsmE family RNA methyltransferase [Alkalispirochaeta americana]SIQ70776.1 RNA methyltransferase, RsmE family [Alkalispirochaeta americana]
MNLILFPDQQQIYHLVRGDHRYGHIRKILRARPGDTLRVGVVNGPVGEALLVSLDEEGLCLSVNWEGVSGVPLLRSPDPVVLLLGHPRPPVLKRLLRDLTTLGVGEIRVFSSALSETSYQTSSLWKNPEEHLVEGLSQGEQTALPKLSRFPSLEDALSQDNRSPVRGEGRFFGTLNPAGAISPQEFLARSEDVRDLRFCVGPERGLLPREEALLRDQGYRPMTLGPRKLRTETAAVLLAGLAGAATAGL